MYKTDEIGVVPNSGTSQLQGEHGLIILCFDSCNRWNTIILERSSKVVFLEKVLHMNLTV